MIGDKSVDSIFARQESRASRDSDSVKWSVDCERISRCETRAGNFDAIYPVVVHDRLNRLSSDSNDKHALLHPFRTRPVRVADHFAQLFDVIDAAALSQLTDSVVCKYRQS